jgi:hypothetical protein
MSPTQDIIKDTKPLNLLEERAKFFADPTYNPQFQYSRTIAPEELTPWGLPKHEFYRHALEMVEYWNTEGRYSSPVLKSPTATQEYIVERVEHFNHHYKLTKPMVVRFSENTVTRCHISGHTLTIRLPIHYTESSLRDLLRHELETHYLRRSNDRQQPWTQAGFADEIFRKTEEGLANLHTFLLRSEQLILKTYRTYIAVYLAQELSFAELFAKLCSLDIPSDTAFLLALRTKRGLEDTSQPGGLTKDVSYFEGSVHVWNWLMDESHDPHDLYLGRISYEQIEELKPTAKTEELLYPTFFNDMEIYRQNIASIGKRNNFSALIDTLAAAEKRRA